MQLIGTLLFRAAVWCFRHPQQVKAANLELQHILVLVAEIHKKQTAVSK